MCELDDVLLAKLLKDAVACRLKVLALERIIEEMILFGTEQKQTLGAISILQGGLKDE
uniref:Uncharacterized protein n=1 Tax=viral metagenome TaxID=1070528 RepID=A0A6M3L8F8_9ZZZZ